MVDGIPLVAMEAAGSGQTDELAASLAGYESRSPEERARALIDLLQSFMEGDEEEQRETFQFLKKAIDEDRTSYRRRFSD